MEAHTDKPAASPWFFSWWARILLVMLVILAASLVPYRVLLSLQKHISPTIIILLITIVIFAIDALRENQTVSELHWLAHIVSFTAMLAVIASGSKSVFDWRTERFDPIRHVSGKGYVNFNRLLTPGSFRPMREAAQVQILSSMVGPSSQEGTLSVRDVRLTTRNRNINGHEMLEQLSTITFEITSDALPLPNRFHDISAKTFTKDCNYLELTLGVWPSDVQYDCVVWLTLNDTRTYTFVMPTAYPSKFPAVFVPLNKGARVEMMKYKLFNPLTGKLQHFIDLSP